MWTPELKDSTFFKKGKEHLDENLSRHVNMYMLERTKL